MRRKFDPAHADRLLQGERHRWQSPERVLANLRLQPGETFVDIGAGPGYFALPAARMVGPGGRVYAVDISLDMLMQLGQRLYAEGISNVEKVLSRETNIPLPDACADAILLSNVLHEAEDAAALLAEARRLARPGGRLLVAEWRRQETPVGPPLEERLDPEPVLRQAEAVGWRRVAEADVGDYHWGLLLVAVAEGEQPAS